MRIPTPSSALVLCDKFKSTLSAKDACQAIHAGLAASLPALKTILLPAADGGEGSSATIADVVGAREVVVSVFDPMGQLTNASYYILEEKAFIDLSAASGFNLVQDKDSIKAKRASSYGTGQVISHAIAHGAKDIYLFLGGSATTDGGVGIAKALGIKFLDSEKNILPNPDGKSNYPGEQLRKVAYVEGIQEKGISKIKIHGVVDVKNPLFGENGAAYVYGPQKGADSEAVIELDHDLRHISRIVEEVLGSSSAKSPGSGAAGGCGFGLCAFLGADLISGPTFFLDMLGFDEKLSRADIVVFGEGCLDSQSLKGKLFSEAYRRCSSQNKTLIALCGVLDLSEHELKSYDGLVAFGLGHRLALEQPAMCLERLARQVGSLLR